MRLFVLLGAALLAAPVAAQESSAAPVTTAADAPTPVDPARLALATTAVEAFWPLGIYERMLSGTFQQMIDEMMSSMLELKPDDLAGPDYSKKAGPEASKPTIRELMAQADPHFEERLKITNKVTMTAMIPLMNRLEPRVREGMARAYARKFTTAQLQDINRFFATDSGRFYAAESMMLFVDPEVMALMSAFTPELMKEMPSILEQVKEATAHLPPPKVERQRRKDRN